ncbi:MAG TPA: NAD(P)/FAD-dependent oxidoreductase [Polyangiaceae bacterium]
MSWDFDVAVVGGGPAGTSTALHLVRREGIAPSRIVVLEKARHPRDKPCAGAVSIWGLGALAAIDVPLTVPHVAILGLRVMTPDRVGTEQASLGVVVRRCELDASLWNTARADGVAAYDAEPLLGLERGAAGWRLTTARRTLTARMVAACDGAGSTVRKLLGLRESARKGHLYVAETPVTPRDDGPRAGLCDFDLRVADDGVEGYYWDFPTVVDGSPAVSRGIYHANFTPRPDLKQHLARALGRRGVDIAGVKLKPFSTRPLVRGAHLTVPGLALVGEAAGIDATTGEGIAQAILMGGLAAKHMARALRLGEQRLDAYGAEVMGTAVGRHLLQSAWLARHVYGARGAAWRAFLAREQAALEAGARWYAGERLGWGAKARLGGKLAVALAHGL